MFAGFNLKSDLSEIINKNEYCNSGKLIYEESNKEIEKNLEAFIIDGVMMDLNYKKNGSQRLKQIYLFLIHTRT
jgi:hypothetical protein